MFIGLTIDCFISSPWLIKELYKAFYIHQSLPVASLLSKSVLCALNNQEPLCSEDSILFAACYELDNSIDGGADLWFGFYLTLFLTWSVSQLPLPTAKHLIRAIYL